MLIRLLGDLAVLRLSLRGAGAETLAAVAAVVAAASYGSLPGADAGTWAAAAVTAAGCGAGTVETWVWGSLLGAGAGAVETWDWGSLPGAGAGAGAAAL